MFGNRADSMRNMPGKKPQMPHPMHEIGNIFDIHRMDQIELCHWFHTFQTKVYTNPA